MHLRPARYPDLRDGPALWSASKSRRISTRLSCLCFPLATLNFTVIQHGTHACELVAGRMNRIVVRYLYGTPRISRTRSSNPKVETCLSFCVCVCVCFRYPLH